MRRSLLPALLAGMLLAACGGGEDRDKTAEEWRTQGNRLLAAGDAAHGEDAVRSWVAAADAFIFAFRMEDPVDARRSQRAMLAFRVGRAMSKAALAGVTDPRRGTLARGAVFWFGEARALAPNLHVAGFERAVLYESEIESVRNAYRAREEYARFVREMDLRSQSMSEVESTHYARAKERIEAIDRLLEGG